MADRIEMLTSEIRANMRDVLDHITRGGEVVWVHYNRAVAVISPYQEDTMDTYTPYFPKDEDEDSVRDFHTTADEAKNAIRTAIENGGAANADDYDIDAIFAEVYEYQVDTNDKGQELLNTAGFVQIVDHDEFWQIVERHDQSAPGPEDQPAPAGRQGGVYKVERDDDGNITGAEKRY